MTNGASAPLNYSPEFAYPAPHHGPPPGTDGGHPRSPPHIPCGRFSEAIWYLRVRRRENVFRKNHCYGAEGGVRTILTHGHTKTAHTSHILAELTTGQPSSQRHTAPCQTDLPCTRPHTWILDPAAPNSRVRTAYPVRTFAQLTAEHRLHAPSPTDHFCLPCTPSTVPPRAISGALWSASLSLCDLPPQRRLAVTVVGNRGEDTAYPQRIVATRPLYRLQDRFAQLSRLQRI